MVATCSGQGCNVQQARLVPRIVHHAVTQVKHFLADARTYLVKMLRIVNIKESYMARSVPRLATAAAMGGACPSAVLAPLRSLRCLAPSACSVGVHRPVAGEHLNRLGLLLRARAHVHTSLAPPTLAAHKRSSGSAVGRLWTCCFASVCFRIRYGFIGLMHERIKKHPPNVLKLRATFLKLAS